MAEPLRDDRAHQRSTHARWMDRRHRAQEADDYQDEWWEQQCGMCRYWLPLDGHWGEDWGLCSNPFSGFDGIARFEHDGCEYHDPADEWRVPHS